MLPSQGPGSSVPSMRAPPGLRGLPRRGRRFLARARAPRRRGAGRRARVRQRRGARRRRRRRRRPHLHAQPPARAARRGRAGRRQARDLREADRDGRRRAPRRLTDAAADAGRIAAVPFVYRYYPTVREARERVRTGQTGAGPADPRHLPAGLAAAPEDDNWRVDERPRRRLARVRRHRLALVRPGRVRHRPSHHAPVRAHADRGRRARQVRRPTPPSSRSTATARPARSAPRTPRSSSSRPTRARSARPSSARSRPAARTACGSRSTAPRRRCTFCQEEPEELWVGRRESRRR